MQETESQALVTVTQNTELTLAAPAMILAAGPAAGFAWEEFFVGKLRNLHTRRAYLHAVRSLLNWVELQQVDLTRISPGMIGRFFDSLTLSAPTKKLYLAGIRSFFDVLVQRHVIVLNPAYSVRTERYSATEGRTPEITVEQARSLLNSIDLHSVFGYRDRAVIAVLIYTAARAGAVAKLRLKDLAQDANQFVLRFQEKGGKARTIPVRHDLEKILQSYLLVSGIEKDSGDSPLFRTMAGKSGITSRFPMTGVDICRMVKRRIKAAKLPSGISPHSFRACAATDLLLQGIPLDDVQFLLGHSDARTTRLYDRRQKVVTRNIVERISV
jgi:site-specific recombinase XerD